MTSPIPAAFLVFALFFSATHSDSVPSLDDIDDYDDPVLKEIFSRRSTPRSSFNSAETEPTPPLPMVRGGGAPPRARTFTDYESNTNFPAPQRGLPPIERSRPQPSFPDAPRPNFYGSGVDTQSPYYQVGAQFGQLARSGANAFYQGAQQVGQAFGIQPVQYEVPLINAAAGLLGRR
ncbi:hypothetical protein QR680_004920 [Steinernema hermaphroditum]|uniref:Uncharacterized protein n=1 Tax=Steinernema hermaphroditum TaxID=289476 RepID=A0AA39LUG4_9BILA|nr:hypothetical protein QR680_004920 [Steinernema hermaphroditum]